MVRPRDALFAVLIVLSLISTAGCTGNEDGDGDDGNGTTDLRFRDRMRAFVQEISAFARARDTDFVIIPQNGHDLVTADGSPGGTVATTYLSAISGQGREDLYYGYEADDRQTPAKVTADMEALLDIAQANGVRVLVTDYCSTPTKMDDSYARSAARGYLSFAADHRDLDDIPTHPAFPYNASTSDITDLWKANNFLYLLDPGAFADKASYLDALRATDHDVIIMDMFFDGVALTEGEVATLKVKAGGGSRLVISYMSIGEAEDYRYYWDPSWRTDAPAWLAAENPSWKGNYKVKYWMDGWKDIIMGGEGSYLDRVLDAGFDGVYLDIIDAFEYFENK